MPPLILYDFEREPLERWVRHRTTAQALALRSRMILGCAEGSSNTAVAADLGLSDETVASGVPGSRNGDWTAGRMSLAAADRVVLTMTKWSV